MAGSALASDKSSTRPNVIAVPSGPGSITGLGESFEANLNSGSARETVKLEVPPGTAGLAPSLALTYDSGFGNGPVGIGWSLGLSTIQLQTEKGLPRYQGADRYLLDGAELVAVGGGVYRLKLEGRFVRVRRLAGQNAWEVDLPDGKLLRYGVSADARVEGGKERLLDPSGAEEERVRYHYDDPSPLFPGDIATGELAWVEDGAGEEHYRRDERGRLVEFARKVDGKEYRVRHAYDDLDRLVMARTT